MAKHTGRSPVGLINPNSRFESWSALSLCNQRGWDLMADKTTIRSRKRKSRPITDKQMWDAFDEIWGGIEDKMYHE